MNDPSHVARLSPRFCMALLTVAAVAGLAAQVTVQGFGTLVAFLICVCLAGGIAVHVSTRPLPATLRRLVEPPAHFFIALVAVTTVATVAAQLSVKGYGLVAAWLLGAVAGGAVIGLGWHIAGRPWPAAWAGIVRRGPPLPPPLWVLVLGIVAMTTLLAILGFGQPAALVAGLGAVAVLRYGWR